MNKSNYLCPQKQIIMESNKYPMIEDVSMMAAEPAVAYPMTSYADAMAMIHTMHLTREDKERVGRRLVLETTEINLSRALDRLEQMSTLADGWAGEGTLPVSRRAIKNLKNVLLISEDKDWEFWMISPETSGAIGLQSKLCRSSISMGSEEFSYYTKADGIRKGESHIDFDPNRFLSIMREIVK